VQDIRPISIQIPYYTNVRKLCRYYNSYNFINFAKHDVESVLLYSYVVWRNDLLIHTMLFGGFILLEAFVIPADIFMSIRLWVQMFPILWVIMLHSNRKIVQCLDIIIIPICPEQYRRPAWNPLLPTIGQISSNIRVGISEGCFIFDFSSLTLEVARPI